MRIRRPIKLFAVLGIFAMLLLGLFLWWDFNRPYKSGSSWSLDDIWRSTRGLFSLEARRQQKAYKVLDAFASNIDAFTKANADDAEVLTGIVVYAPLMSDADSRIAAIRTRWPQYSPAMELQAWRELTSVMKIFYCLKDADAWLRRDDPNCAVVVQRYATSAMMLRSDDYFLELRDKDVDPNTSAFVVTDVVAARQTVGLRLAAKTDVCIARLKDLSVQDPNNALYEYVMAAGYIRTGRSAEAAAPLKAAAGKTLRLGTAERQKCLKKCLEKAEIPDFVQDMVDHQMSHYAQAQIDWLVQPFYTQAAEADKAGNAELAAAFRDAAQKVVDAAAQSPSPSAK